MGVEQKSSFVSSQTSSLIGKNEVHRAEYANATWKEFVGICLTYFTYLIAHYRSFMIISTIQLVALVLHDERKETFHNFWDS